MSLPSPVPTSLTKIWSKSPTSHPSSPVSPLFQISSSHPRSPEGVPAHLAPPELPRPSLGLPEVPFHFQRSRASCLPAPQNPPTTPAQIPEHLQPLRPPWSCRTPKPSLNSPRIPLRAPPDFQSCRVANPRPSNATISPLFQISPNSPKLPRPPGPVAAPNAPRIHPAPPESPPQLQTHRATHSITQQGLRGLLGGSGGLGEVT